MLYLWFTVDLEAAHYPRVRHGPVFSRWLPNGREDALELPTGGDDSTLEIWLERRGFTDETGLTRYDAEKFEVDPHAIRTQGGLEAGNLFGLLRLGTVHSGEFDCVRTFKHGDPRYLQLGKRVVRAITTPVARTVELLRTAFGQFWLPELEPFDSRKWSLGSYCADVLHLEWSTEESGPRKPFLPDLVSAWSEPAVVSTGPAEFMKYLTEQDWETAKELLRSGYEPPLAAQLLAEARSRKARYDLKAAIVVGATALELAIDSKFRQLVQGSESCTRKGQGFYELKLPQKVIFLGPAIGVRNAETLEQCLDAIDSRNRVVHEGDDPRSISDSQWDGLFEITAAFLAPPSYKLPPLDVGVFTAPDRIWNDYCPRPNR